MISLFVSFVEILKLVLSGRVGQAIEQTIRSYPGLLESNQNLLFMLKCRQFVEMVNGCDFDVSRQNPISPGSLIHRWEFCIQIHFTFY